MVNIQVRDISEATRDAVAAEAAEHGQSMQSYLKSALDAIARRRNAIAMLKKLDTMGGGYTGPAEDVVDGIALQRAERDRRIQGEA
ncbi:hypothetical protein AB0K52_04090 [Glycomyces sp. NPDC049804]|uniref:FitA-like ribbon-helix-helix domain-containing protein n=1 Tax=Glycomyces sp. NPDC049804 TaxID=3154363 RepID=UPI003447F5B9